MASPLIVRQSPKAMKGNRIRKRSERYAVMMERPNPTATGGTE